MQASTHLRGLPFVFGALTVTVTGHAQAPGKQPYTFDNANFWGSSYQILERQNDPEACARFCDQDPRCAVASFHDATATGGWANKCVLRTEQGSRHPEQVGIRSWVKAPAAGVTKATLAGVSMLTQGSLDPTYSDFTTHPEIRGAVQKLHDVALIENEYCGVRMGDGREYVLVSATTSNAELALPHAIAYDRAHQVAFMGRAFASRPAPAGDVPEAFWGRPDPALKLVLTAAAESCTNLRAKVAATGHPREGFPSSSSVQASCRPPVSGEPGPGRYVRANNPKYVLTVAAGCTTPSTLVDPKGNVRTEAVIGPQAAGPGLPAAALLSEMSVCAGYWLKQSNPSLVHVTWAVELTGTGRRDCPGASDIEGDYVRQ